MTELYYNGCNTRLGGIFIKPRILVSACLLGAPCRYDGGDNYAQGIEALMEAAELIPVCPEIYGGLPTPRPPAERSGKCVIARRPAPEGFCLADVTDAYNRGAHAALQLARRFGAKAALLKERSPSCGSGAIYDGTFRHVQVAGDGVTAELLKAHGIAVFGESRIPELIEQLKEVQS